MVTCPPFLEPSFCRGREEELLICKPRKEAPGGAGFVALRTSLYCLSRGGGSEERMKPQEAGVCKHDRRQGAVSQGKHRDRDTGLSVP